MTYRYSSNLKAFRESELDYLKQQLKLADERVNIIEEALSLARIEVLDMEAAVEVKMESDAEWVRVQGNTQMQHVYDKLKTSRGLVAGIESMDKNWRNYEEFNTGYNALRSEKKQDDKDVEDAALALATLIAQMGLKVEKKDNE